MRYSEFHNDVRKHARQFVSLIVESSRGASDNLVSIVEKVVEQEGVRFRSIWEVVKESADKIVNMFDVDSNIKFLGTGSYGIALGVGNKRVLKITTDMDEFSSASLIVGKNLPNVMTIMKVAKKKDVDVALIMYPEYTMLKSAGTKISSIYQGDTENTLREFMEAVADALIGVDDFANFDDSVKGDDEHSSMIVDIRKFIKSFPIFSQAGGSVNIRKPLTHAFLRLGFNSFGELGNRLFKMLMVDKDLQDFVIQILTGVTALSREGVIFRDFHAGNIAYQDGEYILIDLGASESLKPTTGYQIFEIMEKIHE